MCGRYLRRSDKQRIAEAFRLGKLSEDFPLPPDYNIAPATFQPVIRLNRDTGKREWRSCGGLVPYFAKSLADWKGFSTINAKAETLQDRVVATGRALDHLKQAWGRDNNSHTYIAAIVPSRGTPASSIPRVVLTSSGSARHKLASHAVPLWMVS